MNSFSVSFSFFFSSSFLAFMNRLVSPLFDCMLFRGPEIYSDIHSDTLFIIYFT